MLLIESHGEVVGYLASSGDNHAMGALEFDNVHDALEGEFIKIEAVAHVVVGGDGLGIVVDHHRAVAQFANGVQSLHAAPVELHAGTDTIGSGTEHHHRAAVVLVANVVVGSRFAAYSGVGEIEVVCVGGIFGGQGVDLLDHRHNAVILADGSDGKTGLGHAAEFLLQSDGACYLEIGEAIDLGLEQQLAVESVHVLLLEGLIDVDDVLEFIEEPAVNLGEFVNAVDVVVRQVHRLRDDEDALVGGLAEGLVDIGNAKFLVLHETVHTLPYHSKTFLYGFLEVAADGHHLAHGLHRRAQFLVNAVELGEVPAGYLADHIVEGGLEEGRGGLGDGVLQFEQPVAHSQLGGHESQGIARGLAGQSRRAAQAGIDLDDAIVLALGVEGILHVALAHDADVADNLDGQGAEFMIFGVGKRLRGCNHNRLARVNAKRVEVLHVTDGNAIVVTVAHHLVLDFLPTLQRLLNQHLRGEREGFLGQAVELFLVVAEA